MAGELHLSTEQNVLAALDGVMVAVELDDFDVPYLVHYTVFR